MTPLYLPRSPDKIHYITNMTTFCLKFDQFPFLLHSSSACYFYPYQLCRLTPLKFLNDFLPPGSLNLPNLFINKILNFDGLFFKMVLLHLIVYKKSNFQIDFYNIVFVYLCLDFLSKRRTICRPSDFMCKLVIRELIDDLFHSNKGCIFTYL